MLNQNTKKSLGLNLRLLTAQGSTYAYGVRTLTAEPSPSSHTNQYTLSWTTPPFLRAYVLYGWPLTRMRKEIK